MSADALTTIMLGAVALCAGGAVAAICAVGIELSSQRDADKGRRYISAVRHHAEAESFIGALPQFAKDTNEHSLLEEVRALRAEVAALRDRLRLIPSVGEGLIATFQEGSPNVG